MADFQPRILKHSSLGTPEVTFLRSDEPRPIIKSASKKATTNQSGGTGSLKFEDEDGQELGKINWLNGLMKTNGDQTIEVGSDNNSSFL